MVGLAVGIDYTLFILSRYRTELRHTDDRQEAVGRAVGTAGLGRRLRRPHRADRAVGALSVVGIPFLTSMGLAAAGTVFLAVLVALTLLPAILGMLEVQGLRRPACASREDKRDARRPDRQQRRPLGPARRPRPRRRGAAGRRRPRRARRAAAGPPPRAADRLHVGRRHHAAQGLRPGQRRLRPRPRGAAAARRRRSRRRPAPQAARRRSATSWRGPPSQEGVANAQVVGMNKADDRRAGADHARRADPTTRPPWTCWTQLRADQSEIEDETGTRLGVTGITAIQTDVSDRLTERAADLPRGGVGLAFLLLMLVFRSLLVPLTATLGFLLSVLATLGATVLVFQEGALRPGRGPAAGQLHADHRDRHRLRPGDGLPGVPGDPDARGLRARASAREAVVDGFRHSARVVSAAATIMISVFAAFMLQDDPLIQSIGFALAAAVFFDAFVVRMALIPAVMYLLGDKRLVAARLAGPAAARTSTSRARSCTAMRAPRGDARGEPRERGGPPAGRVTAHGPADWCVGGTRRPIAGRATSGSRVRVQASRDRRGASRDRRVLSARGATRHTSGRSGEPTFPGPRPAVLGVKPRQVAGHLRPEPDS